MKNKAFTLVELLGVVILLGILSIVIIPKIGDSISNGKQQAYNAQVETIKKATNDFLIENSSILDNDTTTITLGTLKQGGYLPIRIKNPMTKKDFSNESKITIQKIYEVYKIEVNLQDLENVTQSIDSNSPILVLNGDYIQYVEVNTEYQELGANAMSSDGRSIMVSSPTIKQNGNTVSQIDTSQLKTYNVIYEASDINGTTSATRTVIIRDTQAPVITVPSETTLYIDQVSGYNLLNGITVKDNYDQTITPTVENSTLSDLPGTYVITYTATDSSGNKSTERRVIKVDGNINNYYTNLEYLESTGTQYIMTDIIPSNDMGIYAELESTDTNNDSVFFGSKNSSNNRFWAGNINGTMYFAWNTLTAQSSRPSITLNNKHTIKMNYLNDRKNVFDNSIIESNLETLSNTTIPITIFAGNANGTPDFKTKIKL